MKHIPHYRYVGKWGTYLIRMNKRLKIKSPQKLFYYDCVTLYDHKVHLCITYLWFLSKTKKGNIEQFIVHTILIGKIYR